MKLELHHINFATRDVDKMSEFYKKILQLNMMVQLEILTVISYNSCMAKMELM